MMADDYKKIIDRINISEQKLDQIKIKILTKKSSKRKLVLYPVIAAIIIAGIMYFDLGLNNDIKTNDNNYFITNIYANSQSYELNDDDITIDMSTDIFGSYWQYNRKRAFLPFDIRVIGHNINKITYEIESTFDGGNQIQIANKILDEHPEVDGIFATNDLFAAAFINEARKRGRKIPQDLKIVGYADFKKLV